tara:strand:+ start:1250 stop:1732 length:483 start_codon:yes stop_codon:yes gene_type:complete
MQHLTNNRGDVTSCNGIYVGTTTSGTEWVARANRTGSLEENFVKLCERFDQRNLGRVVRVRKISSEQVIELAEMDLESGAESGRLDASKIKIGATFIEAPRSFFLDLADSVSERAEDWAAGDRSIAHECFSTDLDSRFVEAAGQRTAKSLRKWSKKFEGV